MEGLSELYNHQSKYQRIQVLGDVTGSMLVLGGKIQFTTWDTHRYNEALGILPYLHTPLGKQVLILGGGDGQVAGRLLEVFGDHIDTIMIVDIDPEVTEVCKAFFNFPDSEKIVVINMDAREFVHKSLDNYGNPKNLIIADYTDPSSPHSAGLYTMEHFTEVRRMLSPTGVFATQMVAPFINPKAASCLVATCVQAFAIGKEPIIPRTVVPYRISLPMHPSPGQQGFVLATPGGLKLTLPQNLRFLNNNNLTSLFCLDNDEMYVSMIPSTDENLLYSLLYNMNYRGDIEEWDIESGA